MNNEKTIRKIMRASLPGFWFYVASSFVFALIIQLLGLIPPVLMKNVIDIYIPQNNLSSSIRSIVLFVSIPVIITILSAFYNYCINIVGRKMGQVLTVNGFEKLLFQSMTYYDNHNSSEIASYCKSEAMSYIVFWIFDMPQLIAGIINGFVVFGYLYQINIYIAIGILIYIPLSILPSKKLSKLIECNIKKTVENNAKATQIITDAFKGIKFVKVMMLEGYQIKKLKRINSDTIKLWSKTAAIDNINGLWTNQFIDNLFIGVVFSISAILIIKEQLSLGSLLLILNYMPRFFSVIKSISNTNFNFKRKLGEYDKFFELITMDDERENNENKKQFNFNSNIKFKNICFKYSEERGNVLNNLTFSVDKNKWIGIVGSSGAGKTTIFDLILKLYNNYSGEILIDDVNLQDISSKSIRSNITLVSQNAFLFPGTIKDNLAMVNPEANDEEINEVIKQVFLTDFINNLPKGIDTYIGEDGVQISGGEKQRLSLAQGLLKRSKILLLDEITANIDTVSENYIKKAIIDLKQKNDITVISISHRLSFLDQTDEILIIEKGTVIKKGTYNDLKLHQKYFTVSSKK